jgi:CBS domain-containing membrane protein
MVLLAALPHTPGAQPKNILGGNLIGATVGVILSHVIPTDYDWIAGALTVGLAIVLMQLTDTLHPPAGAALFYFFFFFYC